MSDVDQEEVFEPTIKTAVPKKCDCYHPFQDEEHGKGVRIHNLRGKDQKFVCTVCSTVRD